MENNNIPSMQPKPINDTPAGMSPVPKKKKLPTWLLILGGFAGVLVISVVVMTVMYFQSLRPVSENDSTSRSLEVISGLTPDQIGKKLKDEGFIRSELSFAVYTRLGGVQNKLQAGTYQLSASQSLQEVVNILVKGPELQEFEVTFLPGATLDQNRKVLSGVGFTDKEIEEALKEGMSHPLLKDAPKGADLEGFLFGETHRFLKGATAKDVIERFLDDFYEIVEKNGLVAGYQRQGLSLFEGITLASIIQRESGGGDEAQIAQVFLLRHKKGMQLGSDVTYQYIADKLGIQRDVNLDNKYNTRRYTGLPPGPIATPGVKALQAVASPAKGDYLYFLSGDDNVTYFAHTEEGHQENIRKHCQKKCQII